MKIEKIEVGYLRENCYVLGIGNDVLLIDPGDEADKIRKVIGKRCIKGVLITHRHFDHIGALSSFSEYKEYSYATTEETEYKVGPFKFKVIRTPGHKEDLISFYFYEENALFSGDFIFYETIGRCDLEGGSVVDMQKSIDKIKKYPPLMRIYPGHGNSTTLEHELMNNIYFKEW